jgi:GDP-D-mannose dehydratase
MTKIALITGITGQSGAYLAEFLLDTSTHLHMCELAETIIAVAPTEN